MHALAGLNSSDPPEGGTFVAHHMVFNTCLVKEMLASMASTTGSNLPWPLLIMSYSRKFYRFSEYKTYASFLTAKHPHALRHHRLADFGEGGLRFRDAVAVVNDIARSSPVSLAMAESGGLSFHLVYSYMTRHWETLSAPNVPAHMPAYVQLDHVYGLPEAYLRHLPALSICSSPASVILGGVTERAADPQADTRDHPRHFRTGGGEDCCTLEASSNLPLLPTAGALYPMIKVNVSLAVSESLLIDKPRALEEESISSEDEDEMESSEGGGFRVKTPLVRVK